MRKSILLAGLAGVLVLSLLAGSAGAWELGWRMGRKPTAEKRIEKIVRELGLSQQQKDKYLAGAKKLEEEAKTIRAQNREILGKIEKEVLKEAPDRKAIHDLLGQISRNKAQLQVKRMDQMLDLRSELTPEQKTRFEKLRIW